MNLLMITGDHSGHYCLIKNMSRLFRTHKSSHKSAQFFCDLCLNGFSRKDILEKHQKYCSQIEPQAVYTPEEGADKAYMHFKNGN